MPGSTFPEPFCLHRAVTGDQIRHDKIEQPLAPIEIPAVPECHPLIDHVQTEPDKQRNPNRVDDDVTLQRAPVKRQFSVIRIVGRAQDGPLVVIMNL